MQISVTSYIYMQEIKTWHMGWSYENLTPYFVTLTSLGTPLLLQFALNKILNLVNFLLLLIQEVHDDSHGCPLQPNTLNLVLQSVLHVTHSQRGVDQDYCNNDNRELLLFIYFFFPNVKIKSKIMVGFLWDTHVESDKNKIWYCWNADFEAGVWIGLSFIPLSGRYWMHDISQ